jgi:hypothetical protein
MPKMVIVIFLIVFWIGFSIAMKWPPVCRYAGPDAKRGVQAEYCVNNLRQIEGAKEQFALETGRTNGPIDPAQLNAYFVKGHPLKCPSGGTYFYNDIGQAPVCSLSTNPAPAPAKEYMGPFFWQWKVRPSAGPVSHKLP